MTASHGEPALYLLLLFLLIFNGHVSAKSESMDAVKASLSDHHKYVFSEPAWNNSIMARDEQAVEYRHSSNITDEDLFTLKVPDLTTCVIHVIQSQWSAEILAIHVKPNEKVKRGQKLVSIRIIRSNGAQMLQHHIRSPVDGTVLKTKVLANEIIPAGMGVCEILALPTAPSSSGDDRDEQQRIPTRPLARQHAQSLPRFRIDSNPGEYVSEAASSMADSRPKVKPSNPVSPHHLATGGVIRGWRSNPRRREARSSDGAPRSTSLVDFSPLYPQRTISRQKGSSTVEETSLV